VTINDIRTKYLEFYKARGHTVIPSAPLVPQNDPTTLFTGSGMQPLITYLLGASHPEGARLVDSQKSFRAEDIEEVGDNRHTTFFEMLGNWSLGDYFKREQLPWVFEFLTDVVGLDPKKLYVTAFIGDEKNNVPRDTESAEIWQKLFSQKGVDAQIVEVGSEADGYRLGMRGGRIFFYEARKNWWSRAGVPENMPAGEPGGPDSEIFYDFGTPHDAKYGERCHPNCDCGRFLEIGNSVFMQYIKQDDGSFKLLPKQNVDFGGGLERIAAASINNPDVFRTDVFDDIIALLEEFSKKSYDDSTYQRSFRIVADHVRAAVFMLGDGVRPSNTERGYVLRRLLRRAAYNAQKLEVEKDSGAESLLNRCAIIVMEKYGTAYPEISGETAYKEITEAIWNEERQFGHALDNAMRKFEKVIRATSDAYEPGHDIDEKNKSLSFLDPNVVFELITTDGMPREMIEEERKERNLVIEWDEVDKLLERHKTISRAGSEKKFKGGLADTSEATTRLHTAHHLLLKALQIVLGDHVKQRGSNITQERLRIDFSHGAKVTPQQRAELEKIVNEKIQEALPVVRSTMPKEEAEKLNAQHEFGAKYPDVVSVYSIGPAGATQGNPMFEQAYSIEFCGGPHVSNTGDLSVAGKFKITGEESVAAGVRRIKAVLVPSA